MVMASSSNVGNQHGLTVLPISRVKTIMKSSPEVSSVGQESLFLITKATEIFVQNLANTVYERSSNKYNVEYKDLAGIVDNDERLEFLQEIIPPKIKVSEIYAKLGKPIPVPKKSTDAKQPGTEQTVPIEIEDD